MNGFNVLDFAYSYPGSVHLVYSTELYFLFPVVNHHELSSLHLSSTLMKLLINGVSRLNPINTDTSALHFIIQTSQFIGELRDLFMAFELDK